jgi:hypothetical protein
VTLKFVTGANVGSRVYLMATDTAYQMFKLKNQEFTFDVDMSNVGTSSSCNYTVIVKPILTAPLRS